MTIPAVGDRFDLVHVAGSGGMGIVWRARDRLSGEAVAVKLLAHGTADEIAFLEREAGLLARLGHAAVPRFVAHGNIERSGRYLAMEWLEGEDLGARLRRGPLSVQETVQLGVRIAGALEALHAERIVHCDLKPSNVFLMQGGEGAVKLLDLGIARLMGAAHSLHAHGIIGTPFYMAPEQARGEQALDGQTDLYALGCILFECLTGRPPFMAEGPVAVLTKVLFEEAPRPSELRAGIPRAVDALIGQLLEKDPARRPADAGAAVEALSALHEAPESRPISMPPTTLTQNERRLVSVVLATESPRSGVALNLDSTVAVRPRSAPPAVALEHVAAEHRARLQVLGDGSVAAVLMGSGAPTDLAAAAARCALALRALLPEAQVALVTGWEVFTGTQPLGRVIDRAADLVRARAWAPEQVIVDPMTAALLDTRFVVEGGDKSPALLGEREVVGEARVRRLLGKPTALLGRERELAMLEGIFDACVEESAARAALLLGAAGLGKSRLRSALVERIRARGEEIKGTEIWIARGDPVRRNAPLGLLAQLLRRVARVAEGEPVALRRQKLAARVARCVDAATQRRVTEFLGEIIGTPFPADDSPQLRAARQGPMLMADQMRRAWLDFLEAECRAHPVVIVIEDLHWGDQPTVDFLDAALRVLEDRPLLTLTVARPEVANAFPGLWAERNLTTVQLGPLPRWACARLVREALGDALPDEQVARLVARSSQNPFLLEELVRAVHEGRGDEVPDTVLAMMQARLATLDPEARRVLRAGSLFGELFWRGAIAAMLGEPADLDARLEELTRREWLVRRGSPKFHGEEEYAFRHGLIREAAYEMLTEEDQTLGHRLAGEWLAQAGEGDALVLAEHFEQGGDPARAVGCYHAAAKQALEANDLAGAIQLVERAIACGASGASMGELCLIRAEAHRWQGSFAEGRQWAERALGLLIKGSDAWFSALGEELASMVEAEDRDRIIQLAALLDGLWAEQDGVGRPQVIATAWIAIRLYELGLHEPGEAFHGRLEEVEARFASEPIAHAFIANERAFRTGMLFVDMSACGEAFQVAAERFERAGDLRSACLMRVNLGHVYNELGAYQENVDLMAGLLADSRRLGLGNVEATAKSYLGRTLIGLGRLDKADAALSEAVRTLADQGDQRLEGVSHAYLALAARRSGDLERAEREAQRAVEMLAHVPTLQPLALAALSTVLRAASRLPEALEAARRAFESVDRVEEGETLIRLAHAEALAASGDHAAARQSIAVARDRLLAQAGKIANAAWRRRFLENVIENARTMALAEGRAPVSRGGTL